MYQKFKQSNISFLRIRIKNIVREKVPSYWSIGRATHRKIVVLWSSQICRCNESISIKMIIWPKSFHEACKVHFLYLWCVPGKCSRSSWRFRRLVCTQAPGSFKVTRRAGIEGAPPFAQQNMMFIVAHAIPDTEAYSLWVSWHVQLTLSNLVC